MPSAVADRDHKSAYRSEPLSIPSRLPRPAGLRASPIRGRWDDTLIRLSVAPRRSYFIPLLNKPADVLLRLEGGRGNACRYGASARTGIEAAIDLRRSGEIRATSGCPATSLSTGFVRSCRYPSPPDSEGGPRRSCPRHRCR
jgi:hypothetical protein